MVRVRASVRLFVCGFALFLVEPAFARDYYYFNKPDVDRETYLQDRIKCDELSGGRARKSADYAGINTQIWQNRSLTAGQAAAAAGIASFFMAFAAASERRHLTLQNERICLADKGYRRFAMSKSDYQAIEKTKDDAMRIDQWFGLARSATPSGKEMPE